MHGHVGRDDVLRALQAACPDVRNSQAAAIHVECTRWPTFRGRGHTSRIPKSPLQMEPHAPAWKTSRIPDSESGVAPAAVSARRKAPSVPALQNGKPEQPEMPETVNGMSPSVSIYAQQYCSFTGDVSEFTANSQWCDGRLLEQPHSVTAPSLHSGETEQRHRHPCQRSLRTRRQRRRRVCSVADDYTYTSVHTDVTDDSRQHPW